MRQFPLVYYPFDATNPPAETTVCLLDATCLYSPVSCTIAASHPTEPGRLVLFPRWPLLISLTPSLVEPLVWLCSLSPRSVLKAAFAKADLQQVLLANIHQQGTGTKRMFSVHTTGALPALPGLAPLRREFASWLDEQHHTAIRWDAVRPY